LCLRPIGTEFAGIVIDEKKSLCKSRVWAMLSVFKKLFSKGPQPETVAKETSVAPVATPVSKPAAQPSQPGGPPPGAPSDGIGLSLKAVVAVLPDLLKKRVEKTLNGKELIYVSRGDVLRQLPTGSVKMPFSEIVRQAPTTFSTPDSEMLGTMISLPLQEILPHIKTLPRRAAQRQVEVPTDFAPVFGTGTEQSREVKAPDQPTRTASGSRPSPPPPPDESVIIPKPQARPLPPPLPRPVPPPEPVAPTTYAPPTPPALQPQAPISFKPAEPIAPAAPAPASIPVPKPPPVRVAPVAAPVPAPVAAPAPAAIPIAKPAPAPTPVAFAPPPATAAPVASEAPISLGDVFGQPQKGDWTPQEIVEKAATLRGVAGALITTVDGLPVAFHLPANLSGNAMAAFIPQMYTRITQYTRDLKLGDAKHLTIHIENTPLQIFKSGSVYFTALGKANEQLPKPQLTAIAAALSRPLVHS
jgi:predicted regulator of Ras-like GTPase activity (Roadblock/LC7/MglB family)